MIDVNFIAVIIAAVVSMIIGFVWYMPGFLGNPWMKEMGYTPESIKKAQKKMGPMYALSFVGAIVMAYVLTHVMVFSENYFGLPRLQTGLTTAFWMWLGFVAPVQMTDVIFGGRSGKLFFINTGYQLVSLVAMGIVLGLM